MRELLLLAAAACVTHAASIHGMIVENLTGHPLARATVVVQPVPGSPGETRSTRTNLYGTFEFPPLPAGDYLVTASRPGFAPWQYGQKESHSSGAPLVLEENGETFLNIRLRRYGAISGMVVDENDVGLPEHDIVAYLNTRPPKLAGKATTDDRGVYRIHGLEPGTYVVRTKAKTFEDEGYLPTFSRETILIDQAITADVSLDQEIDSVNVRPIPGALVQVSGTVRVSPPQPVTVTFVSDMGRETVVTADAFHFPPVAPGNYEIYAQTTPDGRGDLFGVYTPVALDRDRELTLVLNPWGATPIFLGGDGKLLDSNSADLRIRRKDLAGAGEPERLKISKGQASIGPGRWEVMLTPASNYYVSTFDYVSFEREDRGRPDGWNAITVRGGHAPMMFKLSAHPGAVRGTVKDGNDPSVGAPVFLEAYDPDQRKRLKDVIAARTNTHGGYEFAGVAPGAYRVFASFEYQSPDESACDRASAVLVRVDEDAVARQDLDLYTIR